MGLSVIIPAYNEEKYLEKTLQAIHNAEIIVVCNGCTDRTEAVARKYTDKVLVLKEKGVSHARNAGATIATHPRLVFLDADILVAEGLLPVIAGSPYTIGTSKVRADEGSIIENTFMRLKSQLHRFGYCTGLIFCEKELFEKVGGFPENLSKREDTLFLKKAKKKGAFGVVDSYVYNNMRRYRKKGYLSTLFFWIGEYLHSSEEDYPSIR